MFEFEWDPAKAAKNLRKHKVSFDDAATVFLDPFSRSVPDEGHNQYEERWITMGTARDGRLLVVSHTHSGIADHGISARLISARMATPGERRQYESRK